MRTMTELMPLVRVCKYFIDTCVFYVILTHRNHLTERGLYGRTRCENEALHRASKKAFY